MFGTTPLFSLSSKETGLSTISGFSINAFYYTQQSGNAQPLRTAQDPDGDGSGSAGGVQGGGQDSAKISGPGQLYNNLQQLQQKDPDKFKQVVTDIANQLQTAAQQAGQNPAGQFLSNLADKFQNVANGGDLSQLQPHHHHHHAHGTYNQSGQPVPQAPSTTAPAGSDPSSPGTDIRQLFASIANEVSQALGS
jgi:hypothetical protein